VTRPLAFALALVASLVLAVPGAVAAAACEQWDVTGTWSTTQGNGYNPAFTFNQSTPSLSGSATLSAGEAQRAGYTGTTGSVSGTITGARLDVVVTWPPKENGSVDRGRYTGIVIAGSSPGSGLISDGDTGGVRWAGGGPARCREGKLLAASRDVRVQIDGGLWQPAKVGQSLDYGEVMYTGFKSTAKFRHPGGAIITVKPMSMVKIHEGGIILRSGEVASQVGEKGAGLSDYTVRTATATTSVRGTLFSVIYDLLAKLSVTSVREGTVAVTPENSSLTPVELTAGQEIEVSKKSVSPVSAIGQAGRPAGGLTRRQVYTAITKLLFNATKGCKLNSASEKGSVSAKRTAKGWAASARVAGKRSGLAKWTVTGKKIRPANRLAGQIARRCR
jgi:hypothetical protein